MEVIKANSCNGLSDFLKKLAKLNSEGLFISDAYLQGSYFPKSALTTMPNVDLPLTRDKPQNSLTTLESGNILYSQMFLQKIDRLLKDFQYACSEDGDHYQKDVKGLSGSPMKMKPYVHTNVEFHEKNTVDIKINDGDVIVTFTGVNGEGKAKVKSISDVKTSLDKPSKLSNGDKVVVTLTPKAGYTINGAESLKVEREVSGLESATGDNI